MVAQQEGIAYTCMLFAILTPCRTLAGASWCTDREGRERDDVLIGMQRGVIEREERYLEPALRR